MRIVSLNNSQTLSNTQDKISNNRATHTIQGCNITLTTTPVQNAIKQSKNNLSQCPDKLNIRHLKHISPHGLAYLTSILKTTLKSNTIPHRWKLADIVLLPQRHRQGHIIQAHSPHLSNCNDTAEEPSSLDNSKHTKQTHATLVQNTTRYSDGTYYTH